ncbi:probable DNA repair protein [Alteromonadaceae bacterium Bs31]|nr:probable DNA repair protein [Alteromonadaceae bacterium Bs31]
MQSTLFDRQLAQFFSTLSNENYLVLTPNKRLSRFLLDRYANYQQTQLQQEAFASLHCLSYGAWLQQCWQELILSQGEHLQLISTMEEGLLWESVIEQHELTPALLNTSATATLAQDAWRLIHEWQLSENLNKDIVEIPGVPIFKAWASAFKKLCATKHLLPQAETAEKISLAISAGHIVPAPTLWLYGFDEHSPAFSRILQRAQESGSTVNTLSLDTATENKQRFEFRDDEEEIIAAANWALQRWQNNPTQRIGIVSPALAKQRQKITRIFNRIFDSAYIFPDTHQHAPGYNISAGQPLAQLPIISACLKVLKSYRHQQELEQISSLLRSPFVGLQAELPARSQLDIALREQGELQISLQDVISLCSEHRDKNHTFICDDFYQRLSILHKHIKKAQGKKFPSEWAPIFMEWLTSMAWPGERTLDSIEYQQVQSWQSCLEEFATLDFVVEAVDVATAVSTFEQCCKQRSFQAQTHSSPVQILGVLEAAGLPFDQLWLMNLDDESWPQAPQLNTLLPSALQVQKQLPQSSAERELHYAQRLTSRFQHSAQGIILSSALVREDRQLSASSMIKKICPEASTIPQQWLQRNSLENTLFASKKMAASQDDIAPAVIDADNIRGGSQILKHQSACPFQAFARHRLHSADIPQVESGLSAMERGNLVHEIMEILWHKLKNQKTLLALENQALFELIDQAISQALKGIQTKRFVGKRFILLESRRLRQQIRAWMELEKERSPFTVVFNEGRKTVKLANMPVHIRYDRVDELEDKSLFVLDYKTGKTEIRDWAGERPAEPQVPLYVIANEKLVSGAAFGQISTDEVQYKGIAESDNIAPRLLAPEKLKMDLPNNWHDILLHWRAVLEQLAKDFMAGSAAVDPKHINVTCAYCELKPLCRIKEKFESSEQENPLAKGSKAQ